MGGICCAYNKSDSVHPLATATLNDVKPPTSSSREGNADKEAVTMPTEQLASTEEAKFEPVEPARETPPTVPISSFPSPPRTPPAPAPPIALASDSRASTSHSHQREDDEEEEEDEHDDDEEEEEEEEDIDDIVESRASLFNSGDFGMPVYTVAATSQRVCLFYPYHDRLAIIDRSNVNLKHIKIKRVYSIDQHGQLSPIPPGRHNCYLDTGTVVYGNPETYRKLILPALLLGCRVRDFEQRAVTVIQKGPLVLSMPAQNRRLTSIRLMTSDGHVFDVQVSSVNRAPKRWIVTCSGGLRLPSGVRVGAELDLLGSHALQQRVTAALLHGCDSAAADKSWPLLQRIYGTESVLQDFEVAQENISVRLRRGGAMRLNREQCEAVARYCNDACPAFVVEAPPGSGKTLTAAAMAVSYEGKGLQLFLSTANVPVANMALALAELDYGSLCAIHLISSERELEMSEETRSPFSVLSLAMSTNRLRDAIGRIDHEVSYATRNEKRRLHARLRADCEPLFSQRYDVIFGTVDMALGYLQKPQRRGRRNEGGTIKQQLMTRVQRVVVDEASQLTEAALNALVLSFPRAQMVLIGDSKQLPPFKYERGEIVSELAARSSIEVVKEKRNFPVVNLKRVYRAAPSLISPYSDVFYNGELISCKSESVTNPLGCFGESRCIFFNVRGVAKLSGSSKINHEENACLMWIVNALRRSGYDERCVMVISYYDAQRRLAEETLPRGYELLTVDSAQGREKNIVIVLTTRTSVPTETGAFFNCPLRCNVATSRHKESIIVIGHPSIASAPHWSEVLSPKYFKHLNWSS